MTSFDERPSLEPLEEQPPESFRPPNVPRIFLPRQNLPIVQQPFDENFARTPVKPSLQIETKESIFNSAIHELQ